MPNIEYVQYESTLYDIHDHCVGDLSELSTTDKSNIVAAINEVDENVENVVVIQDSEPESEYTKFWIKESTEMAVQVPTYEEMQNLIQVQNEQPNSNENKIWIKESTEMAVQVPTYEELQELETTVGNLSELSTADKSSIVAAINEVNSSVSSGIPANVKQAIADMLLAATYTTDMSAQRAIIEVWINEEDDISNVITTESGYILVTESGESLQYDI